MYDPQLSFDSTSDQLTRGQQELELFVPQTVQNTVSNQTTRVELPYVEPSENMTLISGQEEDISIEGVLPVRLFDWDHFDFLDAYSAGLQGAAEWVQDVFSLLGSPGTFTNGFRDTSLQSTITDFSVTLEYPFRPVISWSMSLELGEALYEPPPPRPASPSTQATFGSINLNHPITFTLSKEVRASTTIVPDPDASASAERNVLLETGKSRTINIEFNPADADTIAAELRSQWDIDTEPFTVETSFPGDTYEMQLSSSTPSLQAGRLPENGVELIQ